MAFRAGESDEEVSRMIPPSISQELAAMRAESLRREARSRPARTRPRARRTGLLRKAIGTRLVSGGLPMMRESA
jgi:hypothetical protein